jgi:histone H3
MSTAVATKKIITKTVKKTRKQRRQEQEVTTLQEQSKCILPQTTFKRIVTQTAADCSLNRLRFNGDAVRALQTAAEQELTSIFEGAAFCAELGKRDTITVEDMRNFQQMRNI